MTVKITVCLLLSNIIQIAMPRFKPPRLPLPIKINSMPFEQSDGNDFIISKELLAGTQCTGFRDPNESRNVWIGRKKIGSRQTVAVKHQAVTDEIFKSRLIKTSHVNLVNLLAAFANATELFLIYEETEVSLYQVRGYMELEEKYISYICREAGVDKKSMVLYFCNTNLSIRFSLDYNIFTKRSVSVM